MDTTVKSFDDLANLRDAYVNEVKANGQELFKNAINDFFEKCPEVDGVRWTQYAPHFNDGDACVFAVHEPEFHFVPKKEEESENEDPKEEAEASYYGEDDDEDEEWCDSYYIDRKEGLSQTTISAIEKLSDQIQSNDDAMEILFGDGVQVTCTRGEGISADWYDHD